MPPFRCLGPTCVFKIRKEIVTGVSLSNVGYQFTKSFHDSRVLISLGKEKANSYYMQMDEGRKRVFADFRDDLGG